MLPISTGTTSLAFAIDVDPLFENGNEFEPYRLRNGTFFDIRYRTRNSADRPNDDGNLRDHDPLRPRNKLESDTANNDEISPCA